MDPSSGVVPKRERSVVPPRSAHLGGMSTRLQIKRSADQVGMEKGKPVRREWLVMVSLSFISFILSLDATILVTVLPEIAQALHGSAAESFWAGSSYLLTSAVFQPVLAATSRNFGSRQLLVSSIVLFTFGTVFCAVAQDFAVMLVGRCFQGVGGGGIITMTQVIFSNMVPLRQQPKYFSLVLGSWSVGSILGPVVGGALAEHASWRWCFYINFPFCGIGLCAALCFVRTDDHSSLPLAEKLRRMDWLGAVLFVGGTTGILIGISWGGTQHPWGSAATLIPIILGALSVALFAAWQVYVKPFSLLPLSLWRSTSSAAAFYCAFVNGLVLFTALYYVPFFQMSVRESSPIRASIDLFPAVCLLVPGSVLVALLTSRLGRYRWAISLGWAVTTMACGLFILFDALTPNAVFAVALALFGVGNGMLLTGVNVATQAASRPEDRAIAACMYGFMRSLGMPVGVALSGSVFQNTMSRALSGSGLSTSLARESERLISILRMMAETDPTKVAILHSYTRGFQAVFIAMTAMSLSGFVLGFAIQKHTMDTEPIVATRAR